MKSLNLKTHLLQFPKFEYELHTSISPIRYYWSFILNSHFLLSICLSLHHFVSTFSITCTLNQITHNPCHSIIHAIIGCPSNRIQIGRSYPIVFAPPAIIEPTPSHNFTWCSLSMTVMLRTSISTDPPHFSFEPTT